MSERFSVAGQVLAERYQLEEVLGKGSMGAVYRAMDRTLRQPCAVKVLHRLVDSQDEQYGRFVTEAAAITQLFHPNIVQVREFGQERGAPFLVMEFLRGRDLYSVLQERTRLSLMQTLDILRQVGSALHCAHTQGIVHRDIKPKNIFLARQTNAYGDDFEVVKVVDFGLSKFLGRKCRNETNQGTILGTPEYLSPEATLGLPSAVDYRTDQWALGIMAYRMLSGRLPFDSDDMVTLLLEIRDRQPAPLSRLVPELPAHVDAAIRRAMAKKKEDRFATVQDFVRALDGLPSASLALQPQGTAPAQGAPTLLLPQIPQAGVVLSVPEPVIFEVSKRLRDALASRPAEALAVPLSRHDGVPRVEVHTETTRPRAVGGLRRGRMRKMAAGAAFLLSMGLFGSISTQLILRGAHGTGGKPTDSGQHESLRAGAQAIAPGNPAGPVVASRHDETDPNPTLPAPPGKPPAADAIAVPTPAQTGKAQPSGGASRRSKPSGRSGQKAGPRGEPRGALAGSEGGSRPAVVDSPRDEIPGSIPTSTSPTGLVTTPALHTQQPQQPSRIGMVD
jgi:serine/threonine protein kinase